MATKKPPKKKVAPPRRAKVAKRAAAKRTPAKRAAATTAAARSRARSIPARKVAPTASSTRRQRRAVFIDVENTSSEADLFDVIEHLQIDRSAQPVEVAAVGNWRAIGQKLGRRLAGLGAQLVHSAPATGVKDWSDLWIAVAAGCWLGQAEPGDLLDIVSNDRAFDAVGDAAAARGVIFRRLQHKRGSSAAAHALADDEEEKPARRSRRGGRRRGRRRPSAATPANIAPAASAAAPAAPPPRPAAPRQALNEIEPHGATRDQIVSVISRLTGGDTQRWVNLDVLEKALKTDGFARPPGSPRLVTRLRMLKDVEVDSHGRVRAVGTAPPPVKVAAPAPAAEPEADAEPVAKAAPKRRRSRRKPSKTAREESVATGGDDAASEPGADPPVE